MSTVDDLLTSFRKQVALPWRADTPAEYRVWIMHYDKVLDRRVQARLPEFEAAARAAGHGWSVMHLSGLIAPWLATHELFEPLVNQPAELSSILPELEAHIAQEVEHRLADSAANDLFVLTGTGSLFGLMSVARLADAISPAVRGRLLLLYPGTHNNGTFRLLDARDGWSYRAIPIPG